MINRLPLWFRQEIPGEKVFARLGLLSCLGVHTVCLEARCPNLSSCFRQRKVAFLILGNRCSRNCRFCAVNKSGSLITDNDEPQRVSGAVKALGLKYAVITSVTRDDLSDGGAYVFAETIKSIKAIDGNIGIEVLIPDFLGNTESLKVVINAGPCVLAHNLETVRRLHRELKPQADYERSLQVLKKAKEINPLLFTKSSLLLGIGESEEEVIRALQDLRQNDCDIVTLGQYLAPGAGHYPAKEFIPPEKFRRYEKSARSLNFKAVLSGPLVRSSYQAEAVYASL